MKAINLPAVICPTMISLILLAIAVLAGLKVGNVVAHSRLPPV
jgi:hypothetical protein